MAAQCPHGTHSPEFSSDCTVITDSGTGQAYTGATLNLTKITVLVHSRNASLVSFLYFHNSAGKLWLTLRLRLPLGVVA